MKSMEDMLRLLKTGVEQITNSQSYQDYLAVMARFPSYSARNSLLIFAQNPNATLVAGYNTWRNVFGRHVLRGEKGIRIFAPCTYSEESETGETIRHTSFRAIAVFDISQTDGKPLPTPPQASVIEGEFAALPQAIARLEKFTGYSISADTLEEGVHGRCSYEAGTIRYDASLPDAHAFKTIVHECAHALLHSHLDSDKLFEALLMEQRALREIEAESISYLVCQAFGIDCSDYSFAYVAQWKQNQQFLSCSLERIAKTARALQSELEDLCPKRIQDVFEQAKENERFILSLSSPKIPPAAQVY